MTEQEHEMTLITDESRSSDDAVATGPLPALVLGEGHLHVTVRRDVTILTIDGGLDDDLAAQLLPIIDETIQHVTALILDLDQATLLDRSAVEAVCSAVASGPEPGRDCCVVTGRLSGRLVLDRWNTPSGMVVFSTVADALQARAFLEHGYGQGWATSD